jgi:branched-chain amino acid transport system ATP-binding protein
MPRHRDLAFVAAALVLLPFALGGIGLGITSASEVVIFAMACMALNILVGHTGLVSFGHAAYFGLGAYAAGLLLKRAGLPMEAALLLAPFAAGAFAVVYGWFCVRLSGVYLAMLTLAFAQISWSIVFQWDSFTGGSNGMFGVWPSAWLADKTTYYFLALALCGAGVALLWRMLFSPFGYTLRAGRDSPLRAEAIGIDVRSFQWAGFVLAGTLAGLACRHRPGDLADRSAFSAGPCRRPQGTGPSPSRAAGMSAVLQVEGLRKAFGGVQAVVDVSFAVAAGELLALIGPNGAGKSTCFNMLNGQLAPDGGIVRLGGRNIVGLRPRAIWRLGVGRTFQITATFASLSVRENVQMALYSHAGGLRSLLARFGNAFRQQADELLERLGMLDQADRPCGVLAYGDLKRVELAMALANQPRLLLMDEPTAGMAPRERVALMELTARLARAENVAVLFTEHDMDVVFSQADRIIVLDRGQLIAGGRPDEVRANPDVRAVYLGSTH